MEKNKNIILLIILLVVTVLIVLALAKVYKNSDKKDSIIFEYTKEIRPNDFNQYMIESTDIIILIMDKHDISKDEVLKKLTNELDKNNLKDKLICIDKNLIKESFISNLNKTYKIDLDTNKFPVLILITDKVVDKVSYIDENTDVKTVIDYQVLK